MSKIDLTKPSHVHFMGIGGISMSGLAEMLIIKGFTVSGSDINHSPLTDELEQKGAKIFYSQDAANITPDIDHVVYTAAIHNDNPEFMQAKSLGIPLTTRAELLGDVMDSYKSSIAIAGTHGKTTVTGMISTIFLEAGLDPTISIGGILNTIGDNFRYGKTGDTFIAEACEYKNSFLSLRPKYGIILNIEADHLDFFKDLDDIRSSFRQFAANVRSDGAILINGDVRNIPEITGGSGARVIVCAKDQTGDYYPENTGTDEKGHPVFSLYHKDTHITDITLSVFGQHNISNAVIASALAVEAGIAPEVICSALKKFTGVDRRFQQKGSFRGITVVDDYAHHPTEIAATLSTAKTLPYNRIVCVFQSHTYSRTKALLPEFADALALADVVVTPDIYPAREAFDPTISSKNIVELLQKKNVESYYTGSFPDTEKFLSNFCIDGDLLITMGAGNVVDIGEHLISGQSYPQS